MQLVAPAEQYGSYVSERLADRWCPGPVGGSGVSPESTKAKDNHHLRNLIRTGHHDA